MSSIPPIQASNNDQSLRNYFQFTSNFQLLVMPILTGIYNGFKKIWYILSRVLGNFLAALKTDSSNRRVYYLENYCK